MAKTKIPLGSAEAHGSIANALTFQKRKGQNLVRKYTKPTGAPSAAQTLIRYWNKRSVEVWQSFTPEDKDAWKAYTDSAGRTGYHAYISQYMKNKLQSKEIFRLPDGTPLLTKCEFNQAVTITDTKVFEVIDSLKARISGGGTITIDGSSGYMHIDTIGEPAMTAWILGTRALPSTYTIESKVRIANQDAGTIFNLATPCPASARAQLPTGILAMIAITPIAIVWVNDGTNTGLAFFAITGGGNPVFYNSGSQTWAQPTATLGTPPTDKFYTYKIRKDALNFTCSIYDENNTLVVSAQRPVADTFYQNEDAYPLLGEDENSQMTADAYTDYFYFSE